jgi:hypothetical protein
MKQFFQKFVLCLALSSLSIAPVAADVLKTITAGATDQTVTIKIIDLTDGSPETGVVFNTSGIDLKYWRHGANTVTDITEATQTINGAHSDGGIVSVGFGYYRLDLPDAAVASGVTAVEVIGTVTGMIVIGGTVQLTTDTPQTGDSFARLGAPAGASHAADIAAIEAQTDDIGAAGAGLTVLATQASVNTIDDFVDTEVAAILDDTGTSGVVIAETTSNCREVIGCDTQGTLSGTHTSLTADLGTNAPANDVSGMTLIIPTHNFSRVIDSYNTSTGVATWLDATAVTLANANQYYLYATPIGAEAGGGGGDATAANQTLILAAIDAVDNFVDTEIGTLQTSVNTIDDLLDTEIAALQTSLTTIDDFLDTEIAAILADTNELQVDWVNGGRLDLLIDSIKAKTDPMTFTATNFMQVDAQYMNGIEILGEGTEADPWNGE